MGGGYIPPTNEHVATMALKVLDVYSRTDRGRLQPAEHRIITRAAEVLETYLTIEVVTKTPKGPREWEG